jgi:hypothetical protein
MDPGEIDLLTASIAKMVAQNDGPALTAALDEFGWLDLLEASPEVAVPILFSAQGRHGSRSAALHDVLAADVGDLAADMSSLTTTVALPTPRQGASARHSAGTLCVDALCIDARSDSRWLLIAAAGPDEDLTLFRVGAEHTRPVQACGLDGRLHIERVRADVSLAETEVLMRGAAAAAWWSAMEARGRRALCHQISGALAAMLDLALAHARERSQFGQLIGTFQAVRHKLAEAHVAVAAAEAAALAAWESDDAWLAATVAKLVTSRSCATTVAHTQQVLAGIGFTAEHPFHRLMKRALVLDRILGTAVDLAPVVGRQLVLQGCAPRLVDL